MKVTAILKGTKDHSGRQSVYIRINEGEKRTFKTTHIKATPEQFDKGTIINHPQANSYNEIIRQKILEIEFNKVRGIEPKYPDGDFRTYLERCLKQWKGDKAKATLTQFRTEGEKFLKWSGDMKLSKVNLEKLNEYKGYLFAHGYNTNTIAKSFKNLKTILMKAKKERVIEYDPFDLFEAPKYRNPKREYLTKEQVQKIEEFTTDLKYPETLRKLATWFVIGCYTGLRHSDMVQFKKSEHIKGSRLVLETIKTKDIVGMPVSGKLQDLFERVGWSGLELTNQKSNEYLKEVGKAVDIPDLTCHKARHTAAVWWADAGLSIEVVARLLGHKSMKTTAIYFKITNKRIDDELKKAGY